MSVRRSGSDCGGVVFFFVWLFLFINLALIEKVFRKR